MHFCLYPKPHRIASLFIFIIGVDDIASVRPAVIKLHINIIIRNKSTFHNLPAIWILPGSRTFWMFTNPVRVTSVIIFRPPTRPEGFLLSTLFVKTGRPGCRVTAVCKQWIGITRITERCIAKKIPSINIRIVSIHPGFICGMPLCICAGSPSGEPRFNHVGTIIHIVIISSPFLLIITIIIDIKIITTLFQLRSQCPRSY